MRFLVAALALAATSAMAEEATLAGTDGKNALGTVPCASQGSSISKCHAELRRRSDGTMTLAVLLPTGDTRRVYFKDGKASSTDSTSRMSTQMQGDTLIIHIDPGEVIEVPAAAIAAQ
ncbi:hypothetical protein QEZ52_06200 [Aliisedimentitalea scapharcae]|uniref:FHA domain-containing protein n=1 Tax=Aliisedimentitalea scapharcae TaxID=1524259 RepID=A0ABZ2XXV8_9RHOB|nr:hypothetical protein K3727_06105 [Rhodobacteraceae bacterium M382]